RRRVWRYSTSTWRRSRRIPTATRATWSGRSIGYEPRAVRGEAARGRARADGDVGVAGRERRPRGRLHSRRGREGREARRAAGAVPLPLLLPDRGPKAVRARG